MKRPNILILYTDQQRWDALGANGNAEIRTPNLDRLASQGINFNHYFVQNAVCMPSRLSFLTGQYPSTLRITHMGVPVPEHTITLPRLLRNYGYTSANIGKLHFLPHGNRDHREIHPDYGFDRLEISDEPGCYEDAYRAWVRRTAPEQLDSISLGLPPLAERWYRTMGVKDSVRQPEERFPLKAVPFSGRDDATHTAFVGSRTAGFIEEHADRGPWLCVAGFYSPHSPWKVPQKYLDLYDPGSLTIHEFPAEWEERRKREGTFSNEELRSVKHGYYAMISEVDDVVGTILETLERTGQAENTVVVFTSDHGEWLGERLKYGKGYPGLDGATRVPMIMRWPAGIRREGRTVSGVVEGVDAVPTLLECAGIPVPGHLQGSSWMAALQGEDFNGKECALVEHHGWKNIRTAEYRFVVEADGQEQLYHLPSDRHEYRNLASVSSYQPVLAEMRSKLIRKLLSSERPLARVWTY